MEVKYRESFVEKIKKIDELENKIKEIWDQYDENSSILAINNLRIEFCIAEYKYLQYLENICADHKSESRMDKFKKYSTAFSYILATSSLFIAPEVSLPSFMGALFLSVKKYVEKFQDNAEYLYAEEVDFINEKINSFENDFAKKLEIIENKLDTLTNEETINTLDDQTKNNRIASKLLLDIFDYSLDSKKFSIEAPESIREELNKVIKENYHFEGQSTEELVAMAVNDYLDKADTLYDIQESTRKRLHKSKRSYYK